MQAEVASDRIPWTRRNAGCMPITKPCRCQYIPLPLLHPCLNGRDTVIRPAGAALQTSPTRTSPTLSTSRTTPPSSSRRDVAAQATSAPVQCLATLALGRIPRRSTASLRCSTSSLTPTKTHARLTNTVQAHTTADSDRPLIVHLSRSENLLLSIQILIRLYISIAFWERGILSSHVQLTLTHLSNKNIFNLFSY